MEIKCSLKTSTKLTLFVSLRETMLPNFVMIGCSIFRKKMLAGFFAEKKTTRRKARIITMLFSIMYTTCLVISIQKLGQKEKLHKLGSMGISL